MAFPNIDGIIRRQYEVTRQRYVHVNNTDTYICPLRPWLEVKGDSLDEATIASLKAEGFNFRKVSVYPGSGWIEYDAYVVTAGGYPDYLPTPKVET